MSGTHRMDPEGGETATTALPDEPDTLSEIRPGRIVARRFRVERLLGRGGMGDVFLATHLDLNRPVALKLLHPQYADDAEMVERFRREAMFGAKLDSAHVVRVHDVERLPDGRLMVVTEFADGESLRARLKREGRLAQQETVSIALGICEGLAAAHQAGIIHRDLKPDNVVFSGGRPKLIDFGIARLAESTSQLTGAGGVLGTPRYMAPEQIRGGKLGPATDLYALGVMLYEMLSGTTPHASADLNGLIYRRLNEPPQPLRDVVGDRVDARICALVDRLLAADPAARPSSAAEVAMALHETDKTPGNGHREKPSRKAGGARRRGLWAMLGAGVVGVALGLTPWISSDPEPGPEQPVPLASPGAESVPVPLSSPAPEPTGSTISTGTPSAAPAPAPVPAPVPAPFVARPSVELVTTPVSADVYLDGARVGRTPLPLPLDEAASTLTFELRAPGYVSRRVSVPMATLKATNLKRLEYKLERRAGGVRDLVD